jgi:SAM-dependent methyltransferase
MKPKYLGREHGDAFQDAAVALAYRFRAPYPDETFHILARLITAEPRRVLDAGSGRGDLARGLLPYADQVDALDPSEQMIAVGQTLPGGADSKLHWILGYAERAPLNPPYALITAGQSLHWMDWDIVLPRFAESLAPGSFLAVVSTNEAPQPWSDDLLTIIKRYSANPTYVPFDMIAELAARGLFTQRGETRTATVPFEQSVDDYIESFHARSSLARARIGTERAAAFDAEVRALVAAHVTDNTVRQDVSGWVAWGEPHAKPNGTAIPK